MADENTLRSGRSHDPYRSAEASRSEARASDPLTELARLIGKRDPFAEFGRTSARTSEGHDFRPAADSGHDDWQYTPPAEPQPYVSEMPVRQQDHPAHPDFPLPDDGRDYTWRSQNEHYTGQSHADFGPSQTGEVAYPEIGSDAVYNDQQFAQYAEEDAVGPEDEQVYDDPPRARRHGLATALALIGCAVFGTAAAYGYRSYFGQPSESQRPPVITADNSTPTKIVLPSAGDPQAAKTIQDRVAAAGKEQVVSTQEEPVALRDPGSQPAPRVLPPTAAPGFAPQQPSNSAASASGEPKKVRTVTIRPDGSDSSGQPLAPPPAAGSATRSVSAAKTAPPARPGAGPISLDPQAGESASPTRTRTAAAPASARAEPSSGGGILVQLSSQKSESEAQATFRTLQAKYPNELGGRQVVIRRADLGAKGVFYRTMVGPFASATEANQFCASFKAAGGRCVVPSN
jgi:hypothetical protein